MTWVLTICLCLQAAAQSNPTPFDLSSGHYSLTEWSPTSPAGTYPPNMIFHRTNVQDPQLADEMVADYTGAYNLTSGTRINGLGADGFSFLNTATNGNLGAAVLALNTTGRVNIQVTWTGGTVATGAREYRIRLQYRIGTTGSFTDVLVGGQPVEYVASQTAGHSQTFGPITLPAAVENQPVVQLRWKYYYVPPATGTRPQLRVDDIFVTSVPAAGLPTRLSITEIVPSTPSAHTPFSVTVRAEDDNGIPRNVTQNTTVVLSVATGTGTLSGTLTGVISAGTNTVVISGVRYSVAESGVRLRASRTAGQLLADGVSAPFTVLPRASHLAITAAPTVGYAGVPLPPLTVEARRPDGTVDPNYPEVLTVTKVSGPGTLSGTLSRTPTNGVASFTDLVLDQPGTYVLRVSSPDLPAVQTAPFTVLPLPQMSELIVPQYMKSLSATLRLPTWALVELTDLQPNTTYRYFAGGDTSTTTTGVGAGITIFYDAIRDSFYYNPLRSLTTPGQYSVFRTGPGQTSVRLWLNLIPSTNIRFAEGNRIYWLLFLGDSVGNLIRRFSGTLFMRTLEFGSEPSRATGLADRRSCVLPKRILCFYDNEAGTGRPIATAMVQDEGLLLPGGAPFYAALDSVRGAWATLIPNTLPTGIRRIEERRFEDGALVNYWTSPDGRWLNVSTVNPSGGSANPIYIETPCLRIVEPSSGAQWCGGNVHQIRWEARGVRTVRIELSRDSGRTYQVIATGVLAAAGSFAWSVPDTESVGTVYRIRVVDEARPWYADTSALFTINAPPRILEQPRSVLVCIGGPIELRLRATGTGLRFQWYREGKPIPGATFPILRIQESAYELGGAYWCVVTGVGTCPPETSAIAYVYVVGPTRITQQPTDQAVPLGETVYLRVEAEVVDGRYQWRRGGVPLRESDRITGVNSSLLTIRRVQPSDTLGTYDVVVIGRCGRDSSRPVRITLLRVSFAEQPRGGNICAGDVLRLRGLAISVPSGLPIRYQWFKDGVPLRDGGRISGATTEELRIFPVLTSDSGTYQLHAAIEGAEAFSAPALVDVLEAPTAQAELTLPNSLCRGDVLTFTLRQPGKRLRYVLLCNGRPVTGPRPVGQPVAVLITDTTVGEYRYVVFNECGSDTSLPVEVGLKPDTRVTQQPQRQVTVVEGSPLVLSVAAVGSGTLQYQWYRNGQPIPGGTSATLTIPAVQRRDSGAYYCAVRGECGIALSDTARVVVQPVGISEETAETEFQVAVVTQPVQQEVTVRVWNPHGIRIRLVLLSNLGQTLWNGEVTQAGERLLAVPVQQLASGVVWFVAEAEGQYQRVPVLIVR
ncbi:MAG: immunoglobulin domain-containing protein [Candidatus Kapabacteria bacterium]|nr:immunoglobulin domain-containing protein [Candidatus Kapabacteria bacterium]MDW8011664.1 immunoglobulin domain-containing protein [Bacteroidota bacterium]